MPSRPKKPCSTPGCPNLTAETRCPQHAREFQRRYDRQRGSAASRGYGRHHQKRRKRLMREKNYRCERCGHRPYDTSKLHAHHPDQDPENPRSRLELLCESCHNADEEHRRPRTVKPKSPEPTGWVWA